LTGEKEFADLMRQYLRAAISELQEKKISSIWDLESIQLTGVKGLPVFCPPSSRDIIAAKRELVESCFVSNEKKNLFLYRCFTPTCVVRFWLAGSASSEGKVGQEAGSVSSEGKVGQKAEFLRRIAVFRTAIICPPGQRSRSSSP